MKEYVIKGKANTTTLRLPTDIKEISEGYLSRVTNHIHPAEGQVLVALVYREKLALVLNSFKSNKNLTSVVVPIFVKAGVSQRAFIKSLSCGDVVIVTGANLARGIHVNSPYNFLDLNNVINLCSGDTSIYTQALQSTDYHYFVEFKLIPDYDIAGRLSTPASNVDEFVFVTPNVEA